ncbi:hypothetical protein CHF27_010645 [Romboutsia maritimum]|uniref:Leucine-rich repeat domain-containing protein n=1 Tax=Romboutsia maritimum TaxID=2020948 RepID=A0A371IR42_9FIRM|nr:hypothetical protein [Romboutsia maritimum]RDY22955.1 hypothetical protein CHF27_010645 [Romboutsia maritimum]
MKLIGLLPFIIASAAFNADVNDKILNANQLQEIFPDPNLRTVIKRYIDPSELTINKIKALDGEFYATGEKISNLQGISLLENVDNFIFWNNNIKELPKEILQLDDIDNINIANNYISNEDTVNKLLKKGVHVNYDLNFIYNKDNQYNLDSKYKVMTLSKGEKFDVRRILYKDINEYEKYWEICKEIPKDLNFSVSTSDKSIISVNDTIIKTNKLGQAIVRVCLNDKNNNPLDEVCVTINVD